MKYIITDEKHPIYNAYRVVASEDDPSKGIKAGDLGGFVEKKENLSEDGTAWVYPDAVILGESIVTGDAIVQGSAVLSNVIVAFDSSIIDMPLSEFIFKNPVKIYGKRNSIVITDGELQYKSITAKRVSGDTIMIGYSTFFGNLDQFNTYMETDQISDTDRELLHEYIPLIKNRFFANI